MEETLLDKITKDPNNVYITNRWLNNQTGAIIDLKADCNFRFIDYETEGGPRRKHITEESQLLCPVVACGLVGYWIHRKDKEGTKAIFDGYYELCLKNYEKSHECDDDAWERDLKKEFVCRHHVPTEKKLIKASETLFQYITVNDKKKIKSIMTNYLKYARSKRKQLYPPNHPTNRIIEDTFLDAYRVGGPAYECMSWMRIEYNLPYMGPHWNIDGKTEKERLSGKRKELHERILPEYIAEEYEDFDYRVLMNRNGELMSEIDENFKKNQTQEDRIRYIISLLQPFKEFADAFDARVRINERKRSIKEYEKWIKEWENMPNDAVDERTGAPIHPQKQISAIKEEIGNCKNDIDYWEKVQSDFYWFAQRGLGGGRNRKYPQEINDNMCKYLGGWWEYMIHFARRLAALSLTYGIKLMDVQERCGVYLTWRFMIHDYVDNKYITSDEHARKLLDEIDAKKSKKEINSKVEASLKEDDKEAISINSIKEKILQKQNSDFEHLIKWKNNPDLDFYLSENHWNFHVNTVLYKHLLVFYEGKEVGAFLDVDKDSFSQPIKDYTSLYGNLFNEAYRLCYKVLTTSVPQTKIACFANQAATWKLQNVKDEDGNSYDITPNVIDLIESYHILGMVNAILTFSNVQKDIVNEFLIAFSVYNDKGLYFRGYTHCFKPYNEAYQGLIVPTIIDGSNLRFGYDNKNRDEYLRKNIPWYKNLAKELDKKMETSNDGKSSGMPQQQNINSNVFNNCQVTVNTIPAVKPASNKKTKTAKPKKKVDSKTNNKPKTLKYYSHGNNGILMKQHKRVDIIFKKWNEWGWIDDQTSANDFDPFFEGEPRHCNIAWKASTTVLTLLLQDLLKQSYIGEQKKQSPSSMVREQFSLTPNFDANRLTDDDKYKIKVTMYLLNINNPLLLLKGGSDDDYDTTDAALQAVLSRELRTTKGI